MNLRRLLVIAVVAALLYGIVSNPEGLASLVGQIWDGILDILKGLSSFFAGVTNRIFG